MGTVQSIVQLFLNDDYGYSQSSYNASNVLLNKMNDAINIYKNLNYSNSAVLDIINDILEESFSQLKTDVKVSKTGEGEILIYRNEGEEFRNIIIDNDGDIEYLHIPSDRTATYNEHYQFIHINEDIITELVNKL